MNTDLEFEEWEILSQAQIRQEYRTSRGPLLCDVNLLSSKNTMKHGSGVCNRINKEGSLKTFFKIMDCKQLVNDLVMVRQDL